MKKVELKLIAEGGVAESYKDLAITSLGHVGQEGVNYSVMGERLNVIAKIKEVPAGGVVELEDAEFKILRDCAQKLPWAVVNQDIYDFLTSLESLSK